MERTQLLNREELEFFYVTLTDRQTSYLFYTFIGSEKRLLKLLRKDKGQIKDLILDDIFEDEDELNDLWDLIKSKDIKKKYNSFKLSNFPSKKDDIIKFTLDKKLVKKGVRFTGMRYLSRFIMLDVMASHKNDCILLNGKFKMQMGEEEEKGVMKVYLEIPISKEDMFKKLKECGSNDKMAIIPLSISFHKVKFAHANMLIYNHKQGWIEHFEPHGKTGFNNPLVYMKLRDFFKDTGITYLEPNKVCPSISFQGQGNDVVDDIEEEGFCSSWSIFYADLRLTYQDVSSEDLINISIKILEDNPNNFRRFIRGFSERYKKSLKNFVLFLQKKDEEGLFKGLNGEEIIDKMQLLHNDDYTYASNLFDDFFDSEIQRIGKMI